jgi:SAM-dependent methyltransferase
MDLGMDMWKYFGITHTDHTIMDPLSVEKTRELVGLLRLPGGGHVLDVACGKAEFLCLVAEAYNVHATGVELSPYTIEAARKNVQTRGLAARIELLHTEGGEYRPSVPESLDLASCIGASWVYGGHKGTLEALTKMARPGGLVLVGEPFWKADPDPEYLKFTGAGPDLCGSHAGNVAAGEDLGLALLYTAVASADDWDRYEGLQWQAAERYAAGHPDDPDVEALLRGARRSRDAYVRWGRNCLGWAMYLFQKP